MTGWLRLGGFVMVSGRLCIAGVFTGELVDADGTTIGIASRRRTAPVEITRTPEGLTTIVGPVDVDLLGLTVTVTAFTMDAHVRAPAVAPRANGRRRAEPGRQFPTETQP
jgi:hypothetical protein